MRRSVVWWGALVAMAGGCHRTAVNEEPATPRFSGAYEFQAMMGGQQVGGVIVVALDTISMYMNETSCRPNPETLRTAGSSYRCDGIGPYSNVTFWFDRYSLVSSSTWRATRTVRKYRQVCVEYRSTPDGRQVCARRGIEAYDVDETQSGLLRVWPRGRQ